MDFELSDEQMMISDSVDRFGASHYPPSARLKQLGAGQDESAARWGEMAELGWLGLGLEEGGADSDAHIVSLLEGFGKHLMLEPFVTRAILIPALLATTATPWASDLREGIARGMVLAALALGESEAGFDLHRVATSAVPTRGGGYSLTGTKAQVDDGADAEWFIVPARTSGVVDDRRGISLFLVHRDSPNLTIARFRGIDGHRHARLRLDGVAAGPDALIGMVDEGLPLLESGVDRAIVAHLAEALGSMDAVSAVTLDYIKTRRQFGQAIGAFQVLQHRMVDIDTACEEARSMVYYATANLRADAPTRRRAVSAAKARVGQCGLFVTRQSIQLHGGLGMSAELIVSHHLKRQMMLDLAYGNADYHLARIGQTLDAAA